LDYIPLGVLSRVSDIGTVYVSRKSVLDFQGGLIEEFVGLESDQATSRSTISKALSTAELGIPVFLRYMKPQV
jgi:hypothetical protein